MINSSLLTCSVSRVTLGFYRGGQGCSLERVRGAGAAREEEGQTGSIEGGRNRWREYKQRGRERRGKAIPGGGAGVEGRRMGLPWAIGGTGSLGTPGTC